MFERFYRHRLSMDLPTWQEKGWVSPAGAQAILDSLPPVRPGVTLSGVAATLGAVLLGAGIISFIAANWEGLAPFIRFLLLVLGLGIAYGAAAMLKRNNYTALGDAMILLAGLIFAAAIALVGQAYNLAGEFRDGILLWTIGCLGAGLLTRSPAATIPGLVGICLWAWYSVVDLNLVPHWPSLALLIVAAVLVVWHDTRPARATFVLALAFWATLNVIAYADLDDWRYIGALAFCAAIALVFWALASLLSRDVLGESLGRLGSALIRPSLVALMLALFVIQFIFEETHTDHSGWLVPAAVALLIAGILAVLASRHGAFSLFHAVAGTVLVLATIAFAHWYMPIGYGAEVLWPRLLIAIIILATTIWVVSLGQTMADFGGAGRHLHTLGLAAFGAEVLYIYTVTLGTLIDTALAFLVGGILLIALSVLLLRVDRWLKKRTAGSAS